MLASWLSFAHRTMLDLTQKKKLRKIQSADHSCWVRPVLNKKHFVLDFQPGFLLFCDHNIHA